VLTSSPPSPATAASDDVRFLGGSPDDIVNIFNSMELSQMLAPPTVSSRPASFSAILEQVTSDPLPHEDELAHTAYEEPIPAPSSEFGVPSDILTSDSLRCRSTTFTTSSVQESEASGHRHSASSCVSMAPTSPAPPGGASSSASQLPMSMSDLPALTDEDIAVLLDSGSYNHFRGGDLAGCSSSGGGSSASTSLPSDHVEGHAASDKSRRTWYGLVHTLTALSAQLAVEGRSMREKRTRLVLFYQDALPRLATLGPVGQLAQQRLAVMMAEVGLALNPNRAGSAHRSSGEASPSTDGASQLASGLSSGGLNGANALVGLPNEDEFLEIVNQGLSALRRYATAAIVAPSIERHAVSAGAAVQLAPTPTWFGAGASPVPLPGGEAASVPPMSPTDHGGVSNGDGRPKLHACKNCQKAKTACTDQRPCARCVRLGLTCDGDQKAVRRACANCKRAKVRCNLGDGHPCGRCVRLKLECTEHAKNKKTKPGGALGVLEDDAISPINASAAGSIERNRIQGTDGSSLPPLSTLAYPGLAQDSQYFSAGVCVSSGGGSHRSSDYADGFHIGDLVQEVVAESHGRGTEWDGSG